MKAKDMAARFNSVDGDKLGVTSELLADLIQEYKTIADHRKPSTAAGYVAIFEELDQKWLSFCHRVERDQFTPLFSAALQVAWPDGHAAWMEYRAMQPR